MNPKGVLYGKKIQLITNNPEVLERIKESIEPHNPFLFHSSEGKKALFELMAKNPDLIIYDDEMPPMGGAKVLAVLKRSKPKTRILLLAKAGVPMRSIDVSAQGVSYTLARDSSATQIYNAVKHCLSIATVPRVEKPAI